MKIKRIIFNKYTLWAGLVLAGIILGGLIFHRSHDEKTSQEQTLQESIETIWTCAMHPQIRMDHPGKCPICAMELIPLIQNSTPVNEDAIVMTEAGMKLAEVQTSIVSRENPVNEVRLYGKIQADERLRQTQPAHVPGRIEKLLVNFTGEEVQEGQIIARIYSPELVTAQKELLEAIKMKDMQPGILEAAREKLHQWKFSDTQIADIENSGVTESVFNVNSTVSGIVINKRVNVGDYVSIGTPLYEIADLSNVWALFDAYESDLPWIRKGNNINFTLQSQPGKVYKGKVSFIDPVINPETRVASVRLEIPNPGNMLKPGMFVNGMVTASLARSGNTLVIPQSSVLWTGTRSVVYVKIPEAEEPSFVMREITLGPALSDSYVVLNGLMEGEEIVTNGTFSVDAAAQLTGKPSMMNTSGGKVSTGHDHGAMTNQGTDMSEDSQKETTGKTEIKKINVNMDFIMQLNDVYDSYIDLKNDLVNSDPEKAGQTSKKVKEALAKVDMKLLTGDDHTKWMDILKNINNQTDAIIKSDKVEAQRLAFSGLSDQLYIAIKSFGLMGKTLYYQFCPMFNNNKGVFWISETEEIRNPYYGNEMLTCGETKETLKY